MKTIPIILLLLLMSLASTAQDSLLSVSLAQTEAVDTSKVAEVSIPKIKQKVSKVRNNKAISRVKPDTTLSRIMYQDSVILTRIDKLGVDVNSLSEETSKLGKVIANEQNGQFQSLLSMKRIYICFSLAVLIILAIFFVLAILLYSKYQKLFFTRAVSELKDSFDGLTTNLNKLIARQSDGLKENIAVHASELKNAVDGRTSQLKEIIDGQTSELKECFKQINANEPITEILLPPTEMDCVAYDDAVQAFVNINNYIYDLRRHNSLIIPYILWFTSENMKQPHVDISNVSEDDRSKIALLVSKIGQFKQNHMQAINRYLSRTRNGESYATCLRCPIKGQFDPELDQHLLGEDLKRGEEINSVYKIGYLFHDSKAYPYREKSLII